jgi:ABC-type lipoprotein release transport system permease subunit
VIGALKIALRNVLADRRRTVLITLSLFVSSFLLLMADGIGNGADSQLLSRHRAVQSGDVVACWRNVRDEVDPSDPGRLLFSEFDGKKKAENRAALGAFEAFLRENGDEVAAVYRPIRAFGTLDTGEYAAYCMIYGASPAELSHLEREKAFELIDGSPLSTVRFGAAISEETAEKNGIWVGDYIALDCATPSGLVNSMDFEVSGVYRNGAPWDNVTVYVQENDARALLEWDPGSFASARVFLKNPADRGDFAHRLDGALEAAGGELRAEPSDVSTAFWESFSSFMKALFTFFVIFLLAVVAVGVRSATRMNLFQRIQEFGTLRALGFSRPKCLLIVFAETFIVSLFALAAASALAAALTFALSRLGIYVGPGPASYILGGQYVYPAFRFTDLATAFAVIGAFALVAPLGPGRKLLRQKITDMLAKNQRRVPLFGSVLRRRLDRLGPATGGG